MAGNSSAPQETIGQRIGRLRSGHGWTQAELGARLAMSRVAVSHLEMGLGMPSERTIVVLAGLFKLEPEALVDGTNYPAARRERLPAVACQYTRLELELALLERDLVWVERLPHADAGPALAAATLEACAATAHRLASEATEPAERAALQALRERIATLRRAAAAV